MVKEKFSFYMWHNGMCISYLLRFNQIREFMCQNGGVEVAGPREADHIIVGACGAFLPDFSVYAEKMSEVKDLAGKVTVYGCLPIIDRKYYKSNSPRVDFLVPARFPERIETVLSEVEVAFGQVDVPGKFRMQDYVQFNPDIEFVLIQEGCTEGCVYCPHQLSIGAEKSRELNDIVKQVKEGVGRGAKAFVLEGNNGGAWGLDFDSPLEFPDLLNALIPVLGDAVLHIGDFAPKWVKQYGECLLHSKIRDIKIPIQTANGDVLQRLGRDPYVTEMSNLLKRIRKSNPNVFLRTEIIIGLPTSTVDDLLHTLDFVCEHFDKVACFSFDLHPSCKINRMDIDLYEDEVIAEHIRVAMDYMAKVPSVKADFDSRGKVLAKLTKVKRIDTKGVCDSYRKFYSS